jgi:hypothetical protein
MCVKLPLRYKRLKCLTLQYGNTFDTSDSCTEPRGYFSTQLLLLLKNSRSIYSPCEVFIQIKVRSTNCGFSLVLCLGTASLSHTKPASTVTSHVTDRVQRHQSSDTPPPSPQQNPFWEAAVRSASYNVVQIVYNPNFNCYVYNRSLQGTTINKICIITN